MSGPVWQVWKSKDNMWFASCERGCGPLDGSFVSEEGARLAVLNHEKTTHQRSEEDE